MAWRLFLVIWLVVAGTAAATGAGTTKARPSFEVLAHVGPGGGLQRRRGGRAPLRLSLEPQRQNRLPRPGRPRVRPRQPAAPAPPLDLRRCPFRAGTEGNLDGEDDRSRGANACVPRHACGDEHPGLQRRLRRLRALRRDQTAHPRRLALVRTEPRGSHAIWRAAARGHAWVYTAEAAAEFSFTTNEFGFHIFDVTDPRKPAEIGSWGACRDLRLCTSPTGFPRYLVHSVITDPAARRAFLSYWDLGTVILDIRDPSHPTYLGRTEHGQGHAHSSWLADGGRILVETHETDHGRPIVYDIADAAHPRRLATIRLPDGLHGGGAFTGLALGDSVHDAKVAGKLAYFSWYSQGVALFDLSSPRTPRFLTRFRPPTAADRHGLLCPGSSCTATWGVFPTPTYLLASDLSSGLWVLRLRR